MRALLVAFLLLLAGRPAAARDRLAERAGPSAPPAERAAAFLAWQARHPPAGPHPEPAYRFLAEIHALAAERVRARPGVVRPLLLGRTVRGRPIWAFDVADPARPARASLLVFANIHAMEWVSAEVAVAVLDAFARHPPRGVAATVVPVLNVDGRLAVEADLRAGRRAMRRSNAHGVDLNRDFAVNRDCPALLRALMPRRMAVSPAPLSQPETRALAALAASRRFDAATSLHAFGGFLYFPWAGRWSRPPDWREFVRLGRTMSRAQGAHAYRVRQLSRWAFFFRGCGMEIDHLYARTGTRAFLVELGRSGIDPLRPSTWRDPFRLYNPRDPARVVDAGLSAVRALAGELGRDL